MERVEAVGLEGVEGVEVVSGNLLEKRRCSANGIDSQHGSSQIIDYANGSSLHHEMLPRFNYEVLSLFSGVFLL